MSDIQTVNDALEAIKTDVQEAVNTKASIDEVETAKALSNAAIEEVKASFGEEVVSIKSVVESTNAKLEELEAKFAVLPTISKKTEEQSMKFEKYEGQENKFGLTVDLFSKAGYTAGEDVAGGSVGAGGLIHTLAQANPFRQYGSVIETGSGSIKLPILSGAAFASESTVNPSRTAGGSLTSTTVVVENWVAQNEISKPAAEDIPGLDAVMASLMTQSAGVAEQGDAVAVLAAASITAVNTGEAAALPADTAIVGKLADMAAELSSAYLGNAAFYMSREALSVTRQSNDTVLNFDPSLGLFTIFGYPVHVIDQMADGSTAGDNSVYFGDMARGLAVVSRRNLEISRFMETKPGMVTYFGDVRSKAAAWDVNALVSLNTGA
jgi:HK97 family phage major capsid protein